jgi:nucleoside-diphosphate-sugar epimerase
MKVLLTGAFGNVGRSALHELLVQGHEVRILEADTRRNRRIARSLKGRAEVRLGDLRNIADVGESVRGVDAVAHVGAIIPPAADRIPLIAEYVNVGGTENIVRAILKQDPRPRLIYTSSIAVYGDRLRNPMIDAGDMPHPNADDPYAHHKLAAEALIRASLEDWTILRLTYVVSPRKLVMDPLMFHMPLETSLEPCDTRDVGLAIANAVGNGAARGKILNIAGGSRCRTSFREYLDRMLELFGLGKGFLPEEAFSRGCFHCGFMVTEESQEILRYQRHTLQEYFEDVRREYRGKSILLRAVRPIARRVLILKSPFYREHLRKMGAKVLSLFLRKLPARA